MIFRAMIFATSFLALNISFVSAAEKYLAVEKAFTYACTHDGQFDQSSVKRRLDILATQFGYSLQDAVNTQKSNDKAWVLFDPAGDDNLHIRFQEARTANGNKIRKCGFILLRDAFAEANLHIVSHFKTVKNSEENTGRMRKVYYYISIPGISDPKAVLRVELHDVADGELTEIELTYFFD